MTDSDRSDKDMEELWHQLQESASGKDIEWNGGDSGLVCPRCEDYKFNAVPIGVLQDLVEDKKQRRDTAKQLHKQYGSERYFWSWMAHRSHVNELQDTIENYE